MSLTAYSRPGRPAARPSLFRFAPKAPTTVLGLHVAKGQLRISVVTRTASQTSASGMPKAAESECVRFTPQEIVPTTSARACDPAARMLG
jgi:hypothetical protein